jgi:NitT/TauT family transport system permease protein|tara:strand:+ start:145300 stop:146091 length:792 start_codon:yes stop_codon:yes gene_type:complete
MTKPTSLRRFGLPIGLGILTLVFWEGCVRAFNVSPFLLPGPVAIYYALVDDWGLLSDALLVTLQITGLAFVCAVLGGGLIAVLFSLSRSVETTLFPYAVIMQVTPVVAIAPLLIIWIDNVRLALLVCAWLVAFFPILSNTTVGLNSSDHNLRDMFRLYGATTRQTLFRLRMPSAMPYFLTGVRISGGLALTGAVVAEFVAGTSGQGSGLAYRILEASYQLQTPRMFAALLLISITGVLIFLVTSFISRRILGRWHESAMEREK